jgi:cephalosporin-C deacetylase-like acetyl esterase
MRRSVMVLLLGGLTVLAAGADVVLAQSAPLDLWTPEVMAKVRDQGTLNPRLTARVGYFEVSYNSEVGDAVWADSAPPYAVHQNGTIRIHGYLATPLVGGPYPAIVIGHGHGGRGSPDLAMAVAALGYVALSIDGPEAGGSTGGPEDTEQAWISVEETVNVPSPRVGYLYHYAYAGMRGLTLLEYLSRLWLNPFRIDRSRLGVMGASMGGQFTYYINGVDSRVKAAAAIAVTGDWHKQIFYEGAWLYHGLYYYTRDGLPSGQDQLNTVSHVCEDPTLRTFVDYFDPISYAAAQHGPLLTIVGSHDQYFPLPGINTTYDRVASAGTNLRFRKNVLVVPNGKHGVLRGDDDVDTLLRVLNDVHRWFRYAFYNSARPPDTPTVTIAVEGDQMVFRVAVTPGSRAVRSVDLWFATQVDTFPDQPADFTRVGLTWNGSHYVGQVPVGTAPHSGPTATPDNVLYFARVTDEADFTVTSKVYYRSGELAFCDGFEPLIAHFPRDSFPVPPPPSPNCTCPVGTASALP